MRQPGASIARWLAGIVRHAALCSLAAASLAGAQDYRLRIDAGAQAVSFRGLSLDSIATDLVVPGANGGTETPDGHAVRCGAGAYCFFFRPGPPLRALPVSTSASLVLWGLGVEGLSVRASGRLLADLGRDDVWPATDPFAQLIEGYVDYERGRLRARAGRQLLASRLESIGFDGGWLRARFDVASLEVTGYGGWGLGRAVAVPASSPSLNPLDEWRPRDRQLVAGAEAAWTLSRADLRAEYRREVDPHDGNFVSERAALSGVSRVKDVLLAGGMDFNIAEAHLGSADLRLSYVNPRFTVSAGARRYRPYFSLWTLWGAFSPVAYNAVNASVQVGALDWLSLRARGEGFRYDDADVSTALVPQLQDRGWRTSAGATVTPGPRWSIDGSAGAEFGPGASGRFVEGSAEYAPNDAYSFALYAGILERPLELRYYDAVSRWAGARVQWQHASQRRAWGEVLLVDDDRDRPDAGASSFAHVRVRAGVSLTLGSRADRAPLPPARRPAQR